MPRAADYGTLVGVTLVAMHAFEAAHIAGKVDSATWDTVVSADFVLLPQSCEDDAPAPACCRASEGCAEHLRHADNLQRGGHDRTDGDALNIQGKTHAGPWSQLRFQHHLSCLSH